MSYYHGTVSKRFAVGEMIVPGHEVARWSNWTVFEDNLRRELESGRVIHPQEVVWLTPHPDEAANWASHSLLKWTASEIRRLPSGGIGVYEVEPVEIDIPVKPHGAGEVCCARARVVREVSWEPVETDLCDVCGEPATVGIGDDEQLCADCAVEP
jgi:hypothetical protein